VCLLVLRLWSNLYKIFYDVEGIAECDAFVAIGHGSFVTPVAGLLFNCLFFCVLV
jgi:hypothetical protein